MIEIKYATKVSTALKGAEAVLVLAPAAALADGWHKTALGTDWADALDRPVEDTKPGDNGNVGGTYGPEGAPRRLVVGSLPDKVSRYNSPARAEAIRTCTSKAGLAGKKSAVVIRLDDADHYTAAAVAVSRCFPLFDEKTGGDDDGKSKKKTPITIVCVDAEGNPIKAPKIAKETAAAIRLASRLIDTPAEEMTTAQFEQEAKAAVKGIAGVKVKSIVGDALLKQGMGGLHGVGRTAVVEPRLTILHYKPPGKGKDRGKAKAGRKTIALVGKGVVYDTGGLSLKVGGSMPNMKCDMGGAAAMLGAFLSLVNGGGCEHEVYALFCLAENAIGPTAYRPDDILKMHSGKTVEINNTDAEGRLTLADGVSYAARDLGADVIVDAATLTGAALFVSGSIVCCAMSNRAGLESLALECGRATGDLATPILFAPEFLKSEFASKVADMKNSVKNRMCPQSSAAGQFIYNHIEDLDVPFLHLDIAGPAFRDGRGTGHGAALVAELVRRLDDGALES